MHIPPSLMPLLSQTAGMLAYLLSIYPSGTFNPDVSSGSSMLPTSLLETAVQAYPAFASVQRVYALTHAALPTFVTKWLPSPRDFSFPVPPHPGYPTMSPHDLKVALLELATGEALKLVPMDTPNLLIFNNATTPRW